MEKRQKDQEVEPEHADPRMHYQLLQQKVQYENRQFHLDENVLATKQETAKDVMDKMRD